MFYKDDTPYSHSKEPVVVGGSSLSDISKVLSLMLECLEKPALWHGDRFPQECELVSTVYFSLIKKLEDDKLRHPFKYKVGFIKDMLYCFVTNNKFFQWIGYKFNKD